MIGAGAVLTSATDWELAVVDLDLVGLILMAGAFLGTAVYVRAMHCRRMMIPVRRADGRRLQPPPTCFEAARAPGG
ncbi:hypothetical protein [Streptomyces sp. NPDC055912]|uniref:hypothetical protein n=1 Tax=Streptomyces sp. NPDC055912 TaxID=3345660 RepID=UPI0035DD6751